MIDQTEVDLVDLGQKVDIKLQAFPHLTFHGVIKEKSAGDEMKVASHLLSSKSGGEVATKVDPHSGVEKPVEVSYQAKVPLDDREGLLSLRLRGRPRSTPRR